MSTSILQMWLGGSTSFKCETTKQLALLNNSLASSWLLRHTLSRIFLHKLLPNGLCPFRRKIKINFKRQSIFFPFCRGREERFFEIHFGLPNMDIAKILYRYNVKRTCFNNVTDCTYYEYTVFYFFF